MADEAANQQKEAELGPEEEGLAGFQTAGNLIPETITAGIKKQANCRSSRDYLIIIRKMRFKCLQVLKC